MRRARSNSPNALPLFELQHPYGAYHAFDVAADGQRFLVNTLVVNPKQPGVIASLR